MPKSDVARSRLRFESLDRESTIDGHCRVAVRLEIVVQPHPTLLGRVLRGVLALQVHTSVASPIAQLLVAQKVDGGGDIVLIITLQGFKVD